MKDTPVTIAIDVKGGEKLGRNKGARKKHDATCLGMLGLLTSMIKGEIVENVVIDVKAGVQVSVHDVINFKARERMCM